jgi:hypothetical protein
MSGIQTIAGRLQVLIDEVYDIIECADDIGWRGVQHKAEEAHGALDSALMAAYQYESGRLEASS